MRSRTSVPGLVLARVRVAMDFFAMSSTNVDLDEPRPLPVLNFGAAADAGFVSLGFFVALNAFIGGVGVGAVRARLSRRHRRAPDDD